jgi:predicted metal-binding protein
MFRRRGASRRKHPQDGPVAAQEKRVDATIPEQQITPTRLYVCTTCRAEGEPSLPMEDRAGARLFRALSGTLAADPAVDLVPVECLSVCKRPCTVSLSAPGKWTYVYGDLPPETAAPIILDAIKLYAATPDGLIPWKLRVDAIKKGVVARLPPVPLPVQQKASA